MVRYYCLGTCIVVGRLHPQMSLERFAQVLQRRTETGAAGKRRLPRNHSPWCRCNLTTSSRSDSSRPSRASSTIWLLTAPGMRFQTQPRGRRCDLVVSKIFRTLHSAIAVIYGGGGLCGTARQGVCLGHRQHPAALRTLFDWLVIGQVVAFNLASSVRGPKHVVKTGKTPVLTAAEAHALLDTIDVGTVAGVSAIAPCSASWCTASHASVRPLHVRHRLLDPGPARVFRLHEKGDKYQVVPAHHVAVGLGGDAVSDKQGPLFRSPGPGRRRDVLLRKAMTRQTALKMINCHVREAGLPAEISYHSLRGTGITAYPRNSGNLETSAHIAGHETARTT